MAKDLTDGDLRSDVAAFIDELRRLPPRPVPDRRIRPVAATLRGDG